MAILLTKSPKTRSHKKKLVVITPDPFPSCKKWVKISKPATILYKKLPDDMILVTGFENFMDIEGVLDKYGRKIASTYTSYPYNISGVPEIIFLVGLPGIVSVRIGYVCNKKVFSSIIAHVKKCGGLLHDIILVVNGGEVKRIEI